MDCLFGAIIIYQFIYYVFYLECESLTAVRCLAYFLVQKSKKKGPGSSHTDIPSILMEAKVSGT